MVVILILLAGLLCSSCAYGYQDVFYRSNNVTARTHHGQLYELTLEEGAPNIGEADSVYTVAIFTDIHFGKTGHERHEQDFLDWLLELKDQNQLPKFTICLGDIADHGYESEFENYNKFTAQIEEITGSKVFNVLGNHDLYNDGWRFYHKLIYPNASFYHFKTTNFSWYFIDNASGSLGTSQYNSIKNSFENDSSPKIILAHIPFYGNPNFYFGNFAMQNTDETDKLITLFAKNNVKYFVAGHTHHYYKNSFDSFTELSVPSILNFKTWALFTIDEKNGTVKEEIIEK